MRLRFCAITHLAMEKHGEQANGRNRRTFVIPAPSTVHTLGEMKPKFCFGLIAGILFPVIVAAQSERGSYARIAILRPNNGDTIDFEAGYIRHLDWHRKAGDPWAWYGWTIWAGDRQRWFVYATFGHSANSLDHPVAASDDERDNISNVVPHAEFVGNSLYEYLPALSRGTGEPHPTARLEFTTFELLPGAARQFETALSASKANLKEETLWYRMVAGGVAPRYVRLRPRASLAAIIDERNESSLPESINSLTSKVTIEILNLRPTMSYGLDRQGGN